MIESLETRRLMATVPVRAIPNDGRDDTAAVQATIDRSAAGDVVTFPPGALDLSNPVVFRTGRSYKGTTGTRLVQHKRDVYSAMLDERSASAGVTIQWISFEGGGIQLNARGGASNVRVLNCTFAGLNANTGTYQSGNGIWSTEGLRDSLIADNTFRDFPANTGIQAYLVDRTRIAGNVFTNVGEGIHLLLDHWDTGKNVIIADNRGSKIRRIAIEIQGHNVSGLVVSGNRFADWTTAATDVKMGLSVVAAGVGTRVTGNTLSGPPTALFGLELSGRNMVVEGNAITGFQDGIAMAGASGIAVRDNRITRPFTTGIHKYNQGHATGMVISGNTITDARTAGIDLGDGLWQGTVERNTVLRAAGAWADDRAAAATGKPFRGLHLGRPLGASNVTGNVVRQTASSTPATFRFLGIGIYGGAGDFAGTSFTANAVDSAARGLGVGLFGNSPHTLDRATVSGNTFRRLKIASDGPGGALSAWSNLRFDTPAGGFLPTLLSY